MRKVLCAILLSGMFAGAASAEVVGVLAKMNASPKEYQKFIADRQSKRLRKAISSRDDNVSCRFYASMTAMFMALNAGKIDTMFLPECTADYILMENEMTEARGFVSAKGLTGLTMGFRAEDADLRDDVNSALSEMAKDGISSLLIKRHISGPDANNPKPVKFEKFKGAKIVNVAITGDLPPIDYVDAEGNAAGFNTALLAELGRRLHVNIQLVHIEAGARSAALISGRADCVFWFALSQGGGHQWDIPDGIIVTAPYFSWDKNWFIGISKKPPTSVL